MLSLIVVSILVLIAVGSMAHEYFFTQKSNRSFFEWDDIHHETISISALTALLGYRHREIYIAVKRIVRHGTYPRLEKTD